MDTDPRPASDHDIITVEGLTAGYGTHVVLSKVSFSVREGEIFTILGPSGCGKTTLLKTLTGLLEPWQGKIRIAGQEMGADVERRERRGKRLGSHIGVLFQSAALLGSMSVAENIALPLREFTHLPRDLVDEVVDLKLDLVDLGGCGHMQPAEMSGGMRKRAGLARAIALDPEILFCDEPAAGLDPLTAREIDELILELNRTLGVTMVVITHDLATIDNLDGYCVMLHPDEKGILAAGQVAELRDSRQDARVRAFFERRLEEEAGAKEETCDPT